MSERAADNRAPGFVRGHGVTIAVALAFLAVLTSAAFVGRDMTARYETIVGDFQHKQTKQMVQVQVAEMAWQRYAGTVTQVAVRSASNDALVSALRERETDKLTDLLGEEFNQEAISTGQVVLHGVGAYDTDGNRVARTWQDVGPAPLPDALMDKIYGREGASRLEAVEHAWTHQGRPLLSVAVPLGGLQLHGYLVMHFDVLHALRNLDSNLDREVTFLTAGGGEVLTRLSHIDLPDSAQTRVVEVPIATPGGAPLMTARIRQDVSSLMTRLADARRTSFITFLIVCGTTGLAAVGLIAVVFARMRRREAAMREREEAMRADAERARLDQERSERQRVENDKARELRQALVSLCDDIEQDTNALFGEIQNKAGSMRELATSMTGGMRSIEDRAQAMRDTATAAADNVQAVASATEELTQSSQDIRGRTTEATRHISEAADLARRCDSQTQQLETYAEKIGGAVKLIREIAEQTNLLALNATIEAARAGEAGKGFAVVANEIKQLANQVAKATDEISEQVTGIQSATQESVSAIRTVSETIAKVEETAGTIADSVTQQDQATQDIAGHIQSASDGIQDVAAKVAETAEETRTTTQMSDQVNDSAVEVSQRLDRALDELTDKLARTRAENGAGQGDAA
ncbi:Methyl-accepting chemotaxis protein [Limimonas halophila]|uniref:Methyl-accepting chemotaxis protein n=1 Tax=Limimonas halophila TaxID=1082479 RepID=A0A1G7KVW7_9PROT|nr:methyl-accepting chemotaxis protein [Limimonas halophila]SDF41060.1 Methyl-accepting chemotaxis protein [Limimonas halophila]